MNLISFFKELSNIYRINNWYYYVGFIILGILLRGPLSLDIFINILLGGFLLAYAYSLNDFYDKSIREKYFLIPLFLILFILPFFNYSQIIVSVTFLLITTFYSLKPIKLKNKPFISSICNGIGFSLLFLLGYFSTSNFHFSGLIFMLLLFSFEMVAQFIHEVVHIHKDKKNKIITTAVFLGENKIKKISYFFLFFGLLMSLFLFFANVVDLLFIFITLFFVIFTSIKLLRKNIDDKIRMEYRILGVIIGFLYFVLLNFNLRVLTFF